MVKDVKTGECYRADHLLKGMFKSWSMVQVKPNIFNAYTIRTLKRPVSLNSKIFNHSVSVLPLTEMWKYFCLLLCKYTKYIFGCD